MQFVLMIYQGTTPLPGTAAWSALPQAEQRRIYEDYGDLNRTPGVTSGPPLGLPSDAKTVRVSDGCLHVADGAYCSADKTVGGFLILEAEGIDAAFALAARIPAARLGGAIEIRPVAKYW